MHVSKAFGLCVAAGFALAGCAGTGPTPEQEAAQAAVQETVDQILSAPL